TRVTHEVLLKLVPACDGHQTALKRMKLLLQLVAREQELEDRPDLVRREQPAESGHRRPSAALRHRLFEPRRRERRAEQLLARAAARLMTPGATRAVDSLAESDRLVGPEGPARRRRASARRRGTRARLRRGRGL